MYFIRWVEAGRLHAVRQVGLTGVIQQFEGGVACRRPIAPRNSGTRLGGTLTWGTERHGRFISISYTPCMPCEGPGWGGDTRQLCRCLRGRRGGERRLRGVLGVKLVG